LNDSYLTVTQCLTLDLIGHLGCSGGRAIRHLIEAYTGTVAAEGNCHGPLLLSGQMLEQPYMTVGTGTHRRYIPVFQLSHEESVFTGLTSQSVPQAHKTKVV
jgi:hypothetical protein